MIRLSPNGGLYNDAQSGNARISSIFGLYKETAAAAPSGFQAAWARQQSGIIGLM